MTRPDPDSPDALAFVSGARTATLATISQAGRARLVPICFVLIPADAQSPLLVYSPLDEKPKSVADVRSLGRLRDIAVHSEVTLLVDRWSEDWGRLGWVRLDGQATLIEPTDAAATSEHALAIAALRDKYPQYAEHALESRPMIRIAVDRAVSWGTLSG